MAKCRANCDVPVMGIGTAKKNNKIFASITAPIEGCVNIRTSDYTSISSAIGSPSATFRQYRRPADQLNCPEPLCITTGTLYVNFSQGGDPVDVAATEVTYEVENHAEDYVTGVINWYMQLMEAGTYEVTTKVQDKCGGQEVEFTDAIVGKDTDSYPKYVLIQHAMDEATTVLAPTHCGMKITVSVKPALENADAEVGISSISMVMDKSEFEANATVMMTCIDELDFPTDVDLTDLTCLGQAPDPESISMEMTVTAQQVTGNVLKLNPLLHKSDETTAFDVVCKTHKIETVTVNGVEYQGFMMAGFYAEECSFMMAYLPACDATEGMLEYNTMKNAAQPDDKAFKVLVDEETGLGYIVFNEVHAGLDAVVTYPVEKRAIVYDATDEFTEGTRIRFMAPIEFKNGYKGYVISENAFVTSFPLGWSSSEDTPMEFTITFMKEKGRFYKVVLIDEPQP